MLDLHVIDIDLAEGGAVALALFIASGFTISEAAINSLTHLKSKQILDSGYPGRRSLTLWIEHPQRVMTTITIFRSLLHALVAALITDIVLRHWHTRTIELSTGIAALLILAFAEVLPRAIARRQSEISALFALRLVYLLFWIMAPIVLLITDLSHRLVGVFGGKFKDKPPITEEELEYLVDVGERAGVLEETKKEMIEGVFEFDETTVREIMTPRPDIRFLRVDDTYDDALSLAIEAGTSRIPVCDDQGIDHVVGVLLVKDLLRIARAQQGGKTTFRLRDIMREPFFVPESKLVMDVFKDLKNSKNHIAMVVDEHGGTAGLVTMEDILEEIVGEIQDEYDVEEANIIELEPGIYDVAGSYNIDEFLEYFEVKDDEIKEMRGEGIDTIAGWVTSIVGDLPEVAKTVRIGPLNVEVAVVDRRRIKRLRVSRVHDAGAKGP